MPLPRYQPVRKRAKIVDPSLDDLDDYCLSKIIGHALSLSSSRDDDSTMKDNGKTERNLSLVSKRWYFLTQTQVGDCGVHRINLDRISRVMEPTQTKKLNTNGSNIAYVPMSCRKPSVLFQKNIVPAPMLTSRTPLKQSNNIQLNEPQSISLFRSIQPKLLKYKHIQIDGTLSGDEFKKLIVALDAARVEHLLLKVRIEKDKTLAKDFGIIPRQLRYLERLTLFWSNDVKSDHSNGLTWTIFQRAMNLRVLRVHLNEEAQASTTTGNNEAPKEAQYLRDPIEKIAGKFLDRPSVHCNLSEVTFIRSNSDCPTDCSYTSLIRSILAKEDTIYHVDTNDCILIEHLVRSSGRPCTTHELKNLKFSSPIKSIDLLSQLMRSSNLGRNQLSIVIDNINQIDEVRLEMDNFKLMRHPDAICQLYLSLRDQKYSDCEDKIKNLVHLSRLAEVIINISAQQRVSIDCCHLMWSVGRALQSSDYPGKCLFRIKLQVLPLKHNANNYSEITIPFGKCPRYKINSNREDLDRHREIMRALKKECYHQFVKSVRDNVTP